MKKVSQKRFILVTRKTRQQELIERFNTWPQAKFYLEHNAIDAQDYLDEHDIYQKCLTEAEHVLKPLGRFQQLDRVLLPNYQFGSSDIVVVIGQDGLVANTLKYLQGQPVIAINPDPARWDGKLLPFEIAQLKEVVMATLAESIATKNITFAEASTNDGQRLLAVNDLFIGPKTHTSAYYTLSWNGFSEAQSSSGVIISTGFGSTGWFQSILAGAIGISSNDSHASGEGFAWDGTATRSINSHALGKGFAWDQARLQFSVREPFPSQATGVDLIFGEIIPNTLFQMESQMPENGVIFSDGIESDFLAFNSGTVVSVGVAKVQGQLVCGE
ncbi:MAG: sugar kinase [Thiotrichaceae bacterium]|nr:sugar kinase [Thiotrichaceae bacterium]